MIVIFDRPQPILTTSTPGSAVIVNSGFTSTFTVTDLYWYTNITAVSSDTYVATVSPTTTVGPGPITFVVTGFVAGTSIITISDGIQSVNVDVKVNAAPAPVLCIASDVVLPKFPIVGSILVNNVQLDRFSLVYNSVGNNTFPIGQYVFFSKNNSIWYKFKTITQDWSQEKLFIAGGSASNTKFDSNGYPVTACNISGGTNVYYYLNGTFTTAISLASGGLFPTVVINSVDTYVFFVPPSYTDHLVYVQQCSDFIVPHNYPATVPNNINSMQIQVQNDGRFLFSFESGTHKIYTSFSN